MRLRVPIAALLAAHAHCLQLPRAPPPRGRIAVSMSEAAPSTPPDQMRLKEIKEELDARGVKWRGVCFERADLVQAVLDARAAPGARCEPAPASCEREPAAPASSCEPAPAASCEPAQASSCEPAQTARSDPDRAAPSTPVAPQADEDVYEAAYAAALSRGRGLRVAELRAELAAAGVGWAGVTEKDELVARFADARGRAALFSPSGALTPGEANVLDGSQLRAEIADGRTPLLVDVYATWCGPCQMIAPMIRDVAAKLGDQARVAKMDSDKYPELSTELQVGGLPTILFYRGGEPVYRFEGVPPTAAALEQMVSEHLGVSLA